MSAKIVSRAMKVGGQVLGDFAEQDGAVDGHHAPALRAALSSSRITDISILGVVDEPRHSPALGIDLMLRRSIIIRCTISISSLQRAGHLARQ
jgi:hypothetical protein